MIPKLSIIIVNFNTTKLTLQCIDSIIKQTKNISYEIIIVDNNSSDNSINKIKSLNNQSIKIISNKQNVGFGIANNQGVRQAKGEWILLLNSDTKLIDNTVDKMFAYISQLSKKQQNHIFAPQLLNGDGSIQPSGGYFPTITKIAMQMLFLDDLPIIKLIYKSYQQNNVNIYYHNSQLDWVTGAFMLMKKSIFESINGFDQDIFMYGEEVDLCYRLSKYANCKIIADVKCYHYKGKSSVDGFQSAVIGEYKGLITFYKKHFPDKIKLLRVLLWIGAVLRIGLFSILASNKVKAYKKVLVNL